MKLISINSTGENMTLAKNVYDSDGKVLLAQGAVLTEGYIERLRQFGIQSIYIIDGLTSKANIRSKNSAADHETLSSTMTAPESSKNRLCDETQIDEILKGETMIDVVKITNEILDRLIGKIDLPYITTDMESFRYSTKTPVMTTEMTSTTSGFSNDSGISLNGMTTDMNKSVELTQPAAMADQANLTRFQLEIAPFIYNMIYELDKLDKSYTSNQRVDERSKVEVSDITAKIVKDLHKLEGLYTTNQIQTDQFKTEVSYLISNIVAKLDILRTSYTTTKGFDNQMEMDAPGVINSIINGLNTIGASYPNMMTVDHIQTGIPGLIRNVVRDLNKLESIYTGTIGTIVSDPNKLEILHMITSIVKDLNHFESSCITPGQTVNAINDKTKLGALSIIQKMAVNLNQLGTSLITTVDPTNQVIDEQSKIDMSQFMSKIVNELKKIESAFITTTAVKHSGGSQPGTVANVKTDSGPTPDMTYLHDNSAAASNTVTNVAKPENMMSKTEMAKGTGPEYMRTQSLKDQKNIDKDQLQLDAIKITHSILDNLTGKVDVDKIANDRAKIELEKITNSILENLGEGVPVDEALKSLVKVRAYQITQAAMVHIREGIIRSEAIRKVVYNGLRDLISDHRIIHLLVNIRGFSEELFIHSLSVYVLSIMTGTGAKYTSMVLKDLGIAALLHDIGKVFVPEQILNKPDRLTDAEFAEIKRHTFYGHETLSNYQDITSAASLVALQHHERVDGSGYPNRLKYKEINHFARIVALADVYDAMSRDKVYRKRHLSYEIIEYIRDLSGSFFDRDFTKVFLQNIEPFPIGSMVLLNTGEKAIIFELSKSLPARPKVRVVIDQNGILLDKPFDYDLEKDLTLFINQVISK
jgi:HD-GYP domain-containing protein (c-di-GMP phosphodiesterase class II)